MKKKGYLLPENHEPEGYYTLCVHIPRDVEYLREFLGSLDHFGKWMAWEDDSGVRAKEAAAVWKVANELTRAAYAAGECGDMPEIRINPETCLFEVNCSDDPENPDWKVIITEVTDPRTEIDYPVPYPDPPPEGQTNQCLAAANIAEYVWFGGYQYAQLLDEGGLFVEFVSLVMSVTSMVLTLASSIVVDEITEFFSDVDTETILADWTAIDKQDLIDILVCYMTEDGTMPPANFGDFLDEISTLAETNQAWYIVRLMINLMGYGGMSVVALIGGITEAECAECPVDCDWSHEFNAVNGWGAWENVPVLTGVSGTLIAGEWIHGDFEAVASNFYRAVWIRIALPTDTPMRRVKVTFDYTYGSTPSGANAAYGIIGQSGVIETLPFSDVINGTDLIFQWQGEEDTNIIEVGMDASYAGSASFAGSITIKSIELCGMGTEPTW